MSEIGTNYSNLYMQQPLNQNYSQSQDGSNLDAHTSSNMKVSPTQFIAAEAPPNLPKIALFSDIDANKRVKNINNDIYVSTINTRQSSGMEVLPDINGMEDKFDIKKQMKKEEDSGGNEHGFNRKLFFKIFCGVGLTTILITCLRKFRK